MQDKIIYLKRIKTPLGIMFACASNKGICLLDFDDRKEIEAQLISIQKDGVIKEGSNALLENLEKELLEYFELKRRTFTIPLDIMGTDFEVLVWKTLQKIPYGTTKSYKEEAALMNKPKAVRAVANANSRNKISIIIPCHRVIGANGTLTGYAGGLWRKQKLLELEKLIANE